MGSMWYHPQNYRYYFTSPKIWFCEFFTDLPSKSGQKCFLLHVLVLLTITLRVSYICLLYIVSLTVIAYNRCVVLLNCWIKFQPVGDLIIKQVTCSGNVEFVYLSDSKNQLSVKKKAVVKGGFLTLWYT